LREKIVYKITYVSLSILGQKISRFVI
jgi:hypothetical protein